MNDISTVDTTEIVVSKPKGADIVRSRVEAEQALAQALKGLVMKSCVVQIQGRPYVTVTGLTAVARGLGLTVLEASCEHDEAGGFLAVAEVHDETGRVVGRGSGWVDDNERPWNSRPVFARRAMACTRAAGRALRLVLAPVIVGMGYEATAAEEMPRQEAPIDADAVETSTKGVETGLPDIIKRNAGKSKQAMLVGVGSVEAWVNDSMLRAFFDDCVEKGIVVDMSWSKRGKWTSCTEAKPNDIPF